MRMRINGICAPMGRCTPAKSGGGFQINGWRASSRRGSAVRAGVPALTKNASRLLGFDARDTDQDCVRERLPSAVRQQFLLRPEIECPLSIDPRIWPTRFLYYPEVWDAIGRQRPRLIDVDPDCNGGLWLRFEPMKRRLSEHSRSAVLIAVELFAPAETTVGEFPSSLIYSRPDPSTRPAGSVLLGYDVADAGFCSGLSNCGYTDEEVGALRPEWAQRINDYGLLRTPEDAFAFKEISNRRVPEHAPFWVFGLHRLA